VHPLPEEPSSIVDLIPHELYLDFLEHVDLLGLDETRHQDVALFYPHVVGPAHPGNPEAFEVVSEPGRLLLEGEILNLFRRHIENELLENLDRGLLPDKLGAAFIDRFLHNSSFTFR
jgi:hypothetical protein